MTPCRSVNIYRGFTGVCWLLYYTDLIFLGCRRSVYLLRCFALAFNRLSLSLRTVHLKTLRTSTIFRFTEILFCKNNGGLLQGPYAVLALFTYAKSQLLRLHTHTLTVLEGGDLRTWHVVPSSLNHGIKYYPLGTVRPLYRTGVSLLSRERFLYI